MLAIMLVPEEAPWSGPDSFRATVEVNPHIFRGWGQLVGTVVEAAVADMVVVDNVGNVVDVEVVDMVVGTVVDVDIVDMVVVEGMFEDNVAEDIVVDDVDDLVVEVVDNLVVE